jgi:hypothetical protein
MATVIWSNPGNPTNEVSRALGIERHQLRRALHHIERAEGLGGADSVAILSNGEVRDREGNVVGNVYDEI